MTEKIQRDALLEILQRGITEARSFALTGDSAICADLLDALDNIPRHLADWGPTSQHEVEEQLRTFDQMYPNHCTRYLDLLRQLSSSSEK